MHRCFLALLTWNPPLLFEKPPTFSIGDGAGGQFCHLEKEKEKRETKGHHLAYAAPYYDSGLARTAQLIWQQAFSFEMSHNYKEKAEFIFLYG